MMNVIFKRKCKSVPHLRKKIYSKIGSNCLQQQWKTFLKIEQELSSILHELSRAQFDIRNQDKFKYTARSILMMKRQIIKYLQQNQLEQGKNKLKELHQKVNYNEMKKIGMMIIYLECRQQLEKGIGSGKEESIICWLKEKMNEHLNGNEISLIKIKILTILSILILRFHGILMTTQEKFIIFKTIELKKKKMLQIDVREERQAEFQCLLYLLLELYKILYLLKKDQQTILFYYNQLHAYTQIYITRQQNKFYLDINEINKILANMKPILNELDIYEDSKLRKDLAFAHIQQQIIQQENESGKLLQIKKKQQEKTRFSSSLKIGSHKQVRRSSIRNEIKLVINHPTNLRNNDVVNSETIQNVLQIEKHPISYQFLFVSQEKLYVVSLNFTFRNGCNLIDCSIIIKGGTNQQIYELNGIQLIISKLTLKAISKFLQKMINFLFPSQSYFRELHNLYFVDSFLPKNLDIQHIVIAMARIKTQIGQYLKQNYSNNSIIGFKFIFPQTTLQNLKKYIVNEQKQAESKKQRVMISKREGFILKQNFEIKKSTQTCIKILLKKQHQKLNQYYLFNIFFDQYFKGLEIYYFNQKEEAIDLTQFINRLKRISVNMILNHKTIDKHQVITEMIELQNRIERITSVVQTYKVEQQLQINQEKLKPQIISIKSSRKGHKRRPKSKKSKLFQMIKMQKNQYFLFVKQIHKDYMIYKNDIAKLYLPLNWMQSSWKLVKGRLRAYSSIKILNRKENVNYFIKSYREDETIFIKEQLIVLKFLRHRIISKQRGYCMLLEYQTDDNQYLYEIVASKQQRYYYSSPIQIQWNSNIKQENLVKKYSFQLYHGIREKISEANWYYMNVVKGKAALAQIY